MGSHAVRGVLSAWMTLIVLQTVGASGASGRIAGLLGEVDQLIQRTLSPTVAAIPDRRAGAAHAVVPLGHAPTGVGNYTPHPGLLNSAPE